MDYSSGTAQIERILRVRSGRITIGTRTTDALGTSDIRQCIDDAERYISALLSDTITSLPISPAPNALIFASDYLGAYFTHSIMYSANKPDEESGVAKGWKEMAEKAIESYKKNWNTDGQTVKYTKQSVIFSERGVKGVSYGELEGIESDDERGSGQG